MLLLATLFRVTVFSLRLYDLTFSSSSSLHAWPLLHIICVFLYRKQDFFLHGFQRSLAADVAYSINFCLCDKKQADDKVKLRKELTIKWKLESTSSSFCDCIAIT